MANIYCMLNEPVVQIAYFVADAAEAAAEMAATHGAGPFVLVPRIELNWGEVRGENHNFLHTSAYGQWHNVMVEFVQQDEEGPSPFREMYAPGEYGLHHMAMMVDSLPDTYAFCRDQNIEIAARAETRTGTEFAFVDRLTELGHMIEIYEKSDALTGFYSMIKNLAQDWDGTDPVRGLSD